MFDQEYIRGLNQQMDRVRKSTVFSSQFQFDQMAQIMKMVASQIPTTDVSQMAQIMKMVASQIPTTDVSQTAQVMKTVASQISTIDTSQLLAAMDAATKMVEVVMPTLQWQEQFSTQLVQIASQFSDIVNNLAVDFAALDLAKRLLPLDNIFRDLRSIGESREQADAFNSANWILAPSMDARLKNRVVELFHENKSRYISTVIIGYYHRNNFENLSAMVESWREHPLFESRMHIIDDALDAHQNKKFTLSVPALLPHVEGILNDYVVTHKLPARCGKINQVYKAVLGEADDYTFAVRAIILTILFHLEHNTYGYANFDDELQKASRRRRVSRHTVLHGISINYDTSVASLKTFVLLDAISVLHSEISFNHTNNHTN